jgi:hypothetical protein
MARYGRLLTTDSHWEKIRPRIVRCTIGWLGNFRRPVVA